MKLREQMISILCFEFCRPPFIIYRRKKEKIDFVYFDRMIFSLLVYEKIGYDGERTVRDLTTTFHKKRNIIMINKNSAHSYHELFTHGMHVRVVRQSLLQNRKNPIELWLSLVFPSVYLRILPILRVRKYKIVKWSFKLYFLYSEQIIAKKTSLSWGELFSVIFRWAIQENYVLIFVSLNQWMKNLFLIST